MDRLRNFGFLIKDVSRLSSKNFERHANELKLGLTLPQCKVLAYLKRNQGISQTRLADLTDTDPMTLVRILDRLQQEGWLERRPDPADRRAHQLFLRPEATPVLDQIWIIADRARAESLGGLDENDRSLLISLLERIHGNLATLVPGAVDPDRACLSDDEPAQASTPPTSVNTRPDAKARGKSTKAAS